MSFVEETLAPLDHLAIDCSLMSPPRTRSHQPPRVSFLKSDSASMLCEGAGGFITDDRTCARAAMVCAVGVAREQGVERIRAGGTSISNHAGAQHVQMVISRTPNLTYGSRPGPQRGIEMARQDASGAEIARKISPDKNPLPPQQSPAFFYALSKDRFSRPWSGLWCTKVRMGQ